MKNIRNFAILAALLVSPLALYASPSDALAVLQQCGAPVSDVVTQGSAEYPGPQRILTYTYATLHFQQAAGGWNFTYANPAHSNRLRDRAQTSVLLPCFDEAMAKVQLYAPLRTISQPAAAPKVGFVQWLTRPVESGLRPGAKLLLLLLYVLPVIIGAIRRAPQLKRLIAIDLLLGWTVVGWGYALLLANEDRADHVDREGEEPANAPAYGAPRYDFRPERGIVALNLMDSPQQLEDSVFVPYRGRGLRAETADSPAPKQPMLVPAASVDNAAMQNTASGLSELAAAHPDIRWTDYFPRRRSCRIEILSPASEVTVYDIEIAACGVDPQGREVIGGYAGKEFMVFPVESIAHLRELAA